METSWIVTADAGRARIFSQSNLTQPLTEIEDMVNPATRMRTAEKYTDRLGPTSAGQSIHNTGAATPNKQYEPPQTHEEHEAVSFAKDISTFLLKGQQAGHFQKLVLIADPKFLGVLRTLLDPHLKPLVKLEINKNYTHSEPQQLREQLRAHQEKHSAH
ncbi:MAG: host attachment protein [Pseudomonadota bacterium]